jgi:hypothetical protein
MGNSAVLQSRAVERLVEPGNSAVCARCGSPVKFVARAQHRQVIANVYVGNTWDRVEHYHYDCYVEAGQAYGPPSQPPNRKRA